MSLQRKDISTSDLRIDHNPLSVSLAILLQTLSHWLLPTLSLQILGEHDMPKIIRLQLARMKPGVSDIKVHQDSGGYATNAHRIHVPLLTNDGVSFVTCPGSAPNLQYSQDQQQVDLVGSTTSTAPDAGNTLGNTAGTAAGTANGVSTTAAGAAAGGVPAGVAANIVLEEGAAGDNVVADAVMWADQAGAGAGGGALEMAGAGAGEAVDDGAGGAVGMMSSTEGIFGPAAPPLGTTVKDTDNDSIHSQDSMQLDVRQPQKQSLESKLATAEGAAGQLDSAPAPSKTDAHAAPDEWLKVQPTASEANSADGEDILDHDHITAVQSAAAASLMGTDTASLSSDSIASNIEMTQSVGRVSHSIEAVSMPVARTTAEDVETVVVAAAGEARVPGQKAAVLQYSSTSSGKTEAGQAVHQGGEPQGLQEGQNVTVRSFGVGAAVQGSLAGVTAGKRRLQEAVQGPGLTSQSSGGFKGVVPEPQTKVGLGRYPE
jgi:hypothetical protein